MMIKIAVQEDMLPGRTLPDKFHLARQLGIQGIEFWGEALTARVPEIVDAIQQTGVAASAVNHGRQGDLLHPDRPRREAALAALRQSIVNAVDIGAEGVIVVPQFGPSALPDLTPYKSVLQLEYELLHNHLRTLSDYVYALGTNLYLEPVNRYESQFLNTLVDGARVRRKIKDHAHVRLAADLFHLALEETGLGIPQALYDYAGDIGYIHLADSNRRLPGWGLLNFAAIAAALSKTEYQGWAAFACGQPGDNQPDAPQYAADLPACLEFLRQAGW